MLARNYYTATEVAEIMGVSKSYAYKVIQRLNAEMEAKGYYTVTGKVNRNYFEEKVCYPGSERSNVNVSVQR